MEIGDVSEEEALLYLERRKIDKKQAQQIYDLVGGRMIDLQKSSAAIKENESVQGM